MKMSIRSTLLFCAMMVAQAGATQADVLNEKQVKAVLTALDDEYYAVTFFENVIAKFGPEQPFASVIVTEHDHIGRLVALLRAQGVEPPQNLYQTGGQPTEPVPETFKQACEVALSDEVENAELYVSRLIPVAAGNPALMAVFTELRDVSEQIHMPAFRRCKRS